MSIDDKLAHPVSSCEAGLRVQQSAGAEGDVLFFSASRRSDCRTLGGESPRPSRKSTRRFPPERPLDIRRTGTQVDVVKESVTLFRRDHISDGTLRRHHVGFRNPRQ
jgi:hypothetical protein